MRCLNNTDDYHIYGNYDSAHTKNLLLVFEKCDNSTSNNTCKSPQEIDDWILEKYFVVLTNQRHF